MNLLRDPPLGGFVTRIDTFEVGGVREPDSHLTSHNPKQIRSNSRVMLELGILPDLSGLGGSVDVPESRFNLKVTGPIFGWIQKKKTPSGRRESLREVSMDSLLGSEGGFSPTFRLFRDLIFRSCCSGSSGGPDPVLPRRSRGAEGWCRRRGRNW